MPFRNIGVKPRKARAQRPRPAEGGSSLLFAAVPCVRSFPAKRAGDSPRVQADVFAFGLRPTDAHGEERDLEHLPGPGQGVGPVEMDHWVGQSHLASSSLLPIVIQSGLAVLLAPIGSPGVINSLMIFCA